MILLKTKKQMGLLIWKKTKPGQKLHWNSMQYHQVIITEA
nr:unnamed protein product [Callosobruchus analis]